MAYGLFRSIRTCQGASARRNPAWLEPIRWFGRHSYEVYLSHEFAVIAVFTVFASIHRGPIIAWMLAVLGLSAVLGFLLARFFSEPMNRALRGGAQQAGLSLAVVREGEPSPPVVDAYSGRE